MSKAVVVSKSQVDAIATTQKLHPTMSDMKSLPGYTETATGWSAPANGAYGEAMTPFWRADLYRHQCNLGNGAYEPKTKPRGKTQMVIDAAGKLWKRVADEWVAA